MTLLPRLRIHVVCCAGFAFHTRIAFGSSQAGALSLVNVLVANNSRGGVLVQPGAVVEDVVRSTFSSNRNLEEDGDMLGASGSGLGRATPGGSGGSDSAGDAGRGGAISVLPGAQLLTMSETRFINNSATYGGAVSLQVRGGNGYES